MKRKRKNYLTIWFLVIPLLSITPVSASAISNILGDISNFVSTEAMNGLIAWLSELYNGITSVCVFSFVGLFGPDTTLFNSLLGTTAFNDFQYIGAFMMIILYAVMMIFCAFGAIQLAEVKDTPWTLTGRLALGFILMYYSDSIVQMFFTEGSKIYQKIWNASSADVNRMISELSFPVERVQLMVSGSGNTYYVITDSVISLIIAVILGSVFIIQTIKLFLEIIERYLVSCFLYYIFPLPLSTIVAKNSSGIFKKYMQMFIIQIIMLWMNAYFMRIIINMPIKLTNAIFNTGAGGTFMFYLFLFGFIKIARKIDSYAYTMGLSVAITGNNVLDSCKGTGLAMLCMARGLSGGARTAGNVMTSIGATMGNAGILNAGMKLSSVANAGMGRGVDTSMSGVLKEASMRGVTEEIAKNIKPEQLDQSMINSARYGDIRTNTAFNSLSDNTKEALVKKAFGSGVCPDGSTMSNIHFDMRGGFSADFTDSNGVTTAMSVSPTANNRTIGSFTDPDGNGFYFNPIKSDNSATATYTFDANNPESLHQAESHFGQSFSSLGSLRSDVNAVQKAENGDLLFYGQNKANGTEGVLARMDSNGKVSYNDKPFTLSPKTLGKLSTFSDYSDLRMKDNGNGSVSVYGKNTRKSGTPVETATLYNKANYSKEEAQQANGGGSVTSISGGKSSGNWWCVKTAPSKNPETIADLQNAHDKLPSLTSYDDIGNVSGYNSVEVQPFYGGTADPTNLRPDPTPNPDPNPDPTPDPAPEPEYDPDPDPTPESDPNLEPDDYNSLEMFDATFDEDYYE